MITVRVFGVTRLLLMASILEIDADSVKGALKIISNLYEDITLKELKHFNAKIND